MNISKKSFSIHWLIPSLIFLTVLFLTLQAYLIAFPAVLSDRKATAHEQLTHIIHQEQKTIRHLFHDQTPTEIHQNLKIMHIGDDNIRFTAIFDDQGHLFDVSRNENRQQAIENFQKFTSRYSGKIPPLTVPIIYQGENDYHFHAVAALGDVPGYLYIEYDYENDVQIGKEIIYRGLLNSFFIALIMFVLLGYFIHRVFVKNILKLQTAAEKVALGDYRFHLPHSKIKEISSIIASFNRMTYHLEKDQQIIEENRLQLQQEKETAQNYLDIAGVMILVLDLNKNVILINQYGCDIIGYSAEEVIGKNWIENFLPERFRTKVQVVAETLNTSAPIDYFENPVLTKKGEERLIAWRNTYLYDDEGNGTGILTSGQDITDIRSQELQLQENAQFYRTIFSSLNEAIIVIKNHLVVDCNLHTLELFEISKDELIQQPLFNETRFIECKDHTFEDGFERAARGETYTNECSIVLNHRQDFPKIAEITYSQLSRENNTYILIVRDITLKNEQDKLFRMNARQAQMGEMIAMIAHQWRQPLAVVNSIINQIRIKNMLAETEDTSLIDDLEKIEHQIGHLSHTISDFRDFFRSDKLKDYIDISKLAHNAVELIDHTLKNQGILIEYHTHHDPKILTYRNEVLQVLLTLIKNSVDAFSTNHVQDAKIQITLDQNETHAIIALTDNAGGVAPAVIHKLFLPYFTTKGHKDGTGLGLYMSKMVIEEHCGGKLEVSSADEMTMFSLLLPLAEKDPQ